MQKTHYKTCIDPDAAARFEKIAERFGMTAPGLAAVLIHEFSHVRPEAFFQAVGAIPPDLKARPVGRPPGSKTADHAA